MSGETEWWAKIQRLRLSAGLTQVAFARKLGVSFATVNRWEKGTRTPSPLALEKIKQFERDREKQ